MEKTFSSAIMILLVFSVLFISLLFTVSTVCGKVQITSTYYNSEATVTECLKTENAGYSGITVLLPHTGYGGLPYSISSGGTGKSIDEEFSEFSHSIFAAMDGKYEKIGASLKTESGEFEWKKEAKVSSDGLFMGMTVGCEIENGNLEASYSNTNSAIDEDVSAINSMYSSDARITPQIILSNGTGNSVDNTESEFSHCIFAENNGSTENIYASLKTESGEFEWKKEAKVSSDGLFMGMAVGCEIENGNLEASYSNTNSAIEEDVSVINSRYSSGTGITSRSISYRGVSESQSVDNCGFLSETRVDNIGKTATIESETRVDNIGKTATIESDLKEESPAGEAAVDYRWTKKIVLLPEISSIDESILIKSKEGWMIRPTVLPASCRPTVIAAGMKFEAYNLTSGEPLFDTQYVPPNGNLLYLHAVEKNGPLNINRTIDLSMSSTWSPTP